jgi:hypothetical protein
MINKLKTVNKEEIFQYKLVNIEEFLEDSKIKNVRLDKEKQLKREEEEKKMKRIQEKVFYFAIKILYLRSLW